MTTANEFMRSAAALEILSRDLASPATDTYHELRELIRYHLLKPTADLRRIGEALAASEVANAGPKVPL